MRQHHERHDYREHLGYRSSNLFKDLEERALTPAEEGIIAQRVALQRRMLQEYEKKEQLRKVCFRL